MTSAMSCGERVPREMTRPIAQSPLRISPCSSTRQGAFVRPAELLTCLGDRADGG
jgi:hypothetical protein